MNNSNRTRRGRDLPERPSPGPSSAFQARSPARTNGLTDREQAAVAELRRVLARDFGLVKLVLYGSKARGDSHAESDIDLIAVLAHRPDWKTKREIYDRCYRLGLEHDVVIQPVIFAESDFDSPRFRVTPLLRNVAAEGVVV
jgi:predicted nucleotidyltransferase